MSLSLLCRIGKLAISNEFRCLLNYSLERNTFKVSTRGILTDNEFEHHCQETLEELTDFFEELGDEHEVSKEYDASFNNGVLNITVGKKFGTYIINKQSPNKQIWLSSPISGPKRFNFVKNGWQYSHTKETLHVLLENEFSSIFCKPICLNKLKYYGK